MPDRPVEAVPQEPPTRRPLRDWIAWRLANIALRIGSQRYRADLEGVIALGLTELERQLHGQDSQREQLAGMTETPDDPNAKRAAEAKLYLLEKAHQQTLDRLATAEARVSELQAENTELREQNAELNGGMADAFRDANEAEKRNALLSARLTRVTQAAEEARKLIDDWANDRADNVRLVTLPVRVDALLAAALAASSGQDTPKEPVDLGGSQ